MALRWMVSLAAVTVLSACGMMADMNAALMPPGKAPSASSAPNGPRLLTKEESDEQTRRQNQADEEKRKAEGARRRADREAQAHKGRVYELTNGITEKVDQPPHLEAMDTPSDARAIVVQPVLDLQTQLRQYDADAADKLQARVDAWAAGVDKQIADEEKCRKAPQCMADRLVLGLCDTISDRRNAQQQIAKERSNPGGVVDLAALHDLGERIQQDDAAIANVKAQYASLAHRPFSEAACPK